MKVLKKTLSFLLVLALVLGLFGIMPASAVKAADGDVSITLVETTDIHGHLVETPSTDKTTFQYRMAFIAKKFSEYRAKGDTIILNGGDTYQGTPLSNLSYGKYLIQAMEAMKYDATALGNHEFDWGVEKTTTDKGTIEGSTIPVLACNITVKKTNMPVDFAQPYVILERSGKKIAVIGWADEYSVDIMAEKIAPYVISEDASILNKTAKEIKESKKADAVIVLSHEAAEETVELCDAKYVDMVFGGHSHAIKYGRGTNKIPYAQGYKEARGYAFAVMTIKADGTVTVTDPEFIEVYNSAKPETVEALQYSESKKANFDATVKEISDKAVAEVAPLLNTELAVLPVPLTRTMIEGSLTSVMGNWITDMLAYNKGVDFTFVNDGGIRCDFDAKTLTTNDLYTVSPFNNLIYKVEMTGAQIVKLLEQIVGNTSSNMQMSGLTAKYDLTLPEDSQIFDVKLKDGSDIDLNKTYTLLTNEYIATGGNEYTVFLNDVVSSVNLNLVDNEELISAVTALGKIAPLAVDSNPRLVAGSKPATLPSSEAPAAKAKKTTYVGKTFKVEISNLAADAKVVYSSSKKSVAKVSKSGTVTAKKAGKATITAKVTQNGITYKLKVKVTVKKPYVKFTTSKETLAVGATSKFKAKAYGVEGKVKYSSNDSSIASISSKGTVTAKKAGEVYITATVGEVDVTKKVTIK